MKSHAYTLLKFLVGWPLSVLALFFIVKLILPHSDTISSQITHINISVLFGGLSSFIIYYFLRSYIWYRLMRGFGYEVSLKESAHLWSISEIKRYIPGNIWSFLGRSLLFIEKGVKKKDIATAFLLEVEFFVMAGLFIAPLGIPYVLPGVTLDQPLYVIPLAIFILVFIYNRKLIKYLPSKVKSTMYFALPHHSPGEICFFVGLNMLSLIFFGLGYYFSIGSYIPLPPQDIVIMVGFFVLSLIGGYLSLLTPAGFGVREGIIVWGLTRITTPAAAAFASLFSRMILIAAEVIFIALCVFWYKIKNSYLQKIEHRIANHTYEVILFLLFFLYTSYFTVISFLRYDNFYTGRFDLGNMAQTVWNTTQGRFFVMTDPNSIETVSRLAFHADFILVFFAPFYFLWENPKVLLLLQTFIVGAGVFFVYLLAKNILKSKPLGLTFGFLYLLNPSIERANLYDFHAVTLATTFLLGTYYFYRKKQYRLFLLFALLAAICKEQIWLIIGLFGIFLFFFHKQRLFGSAVFVISVIMFYFLISYAIPHAHGSAHFALSYYSDFGDSPTQVIKSMLFSPDKIFQIVNQESRIDYLKQLFSPLGYLSLVSPLFLLFIIPDLIINLLSNNSQLHQIYYQYTATISPFLFIAAIHGVGLLKKLFPQTANIIFILFLLASSLNAANRFGPLPGARDANLDMITKPVSDKAFIDQFIAQIPQNYAIVSSNNIGSHLAHRQHLYSLPLGIENADMVIFLLNESLPPQSLAAEKQLVEKMKQDPAFTLKVQRGGFIVFERNGL